MTQAMYLLNHLKMKCMLSLLKKLICKENPLCSIIEGVSLSTESKVSFCLVKDEY